MKKVLLFSAFLVLALSSCKKDYSCTYDVLGLEVKTEHNDLDKDAAEAGKDSCELLGGDWSLESL